MAPAWSRLLGGLLVLASGISTVLSQSSETFSMQASTFGCGGAPISSGEFRIRGGVSGQLSIGVSLGNQYSVDAGFVNSQVFDRTPPFGVTVLDTGAESTSLTELCASWTAEDPQSGIYDNLLGIGSGPGLFDVTLPMSVGATNDVCVNGAFELCERYFFTVRSRNGAHLWSVPGSSDGIRIVTGIDSDGDGVPDDGDCSGISGDQPCPSGETADCDDNCAGSANADQHDLDQDGTGDACDSDDDGDGVPEDGDGSGVAGDNPCCLGAVAGCDDNCPLDSNPLQQDANGNCAGVVCDDVCSVFIGPAGPPAVDFPSIASALEAETGFPPNQRSVVGDGCKLHVAPGLYDDPLVVDRLVTIQSNEGPDTTVIDVATGTAISIPGIPRAGRITIRGFEIRGGDVGIDAAADLRLESSIVAGASSWGLRATAPMDVVNCVIANNPGVGVQIENPGQLAMSFTTVTCNDSGLVSTSPVVQVDHSIIHGNVNADVVGVACSRFVCSDLGVACDGNLTVDPEFADASCPGDYRLLASSPVVDLALAGCGAPQDYPGLPCVDLPGRPRSLDGEGDGLAQPDPGAYECDALLQHEIYDLEKRDRILLMLDRPDGPSSSWTRLMWDPGEDHDYSGYNLYRGVLDELGYDDWGQCFAEAPGGATSEWFDGETSPGSGFFYLVTGRGLDEHTKGYASCVERSNYDRCVTMPAP